MDRLPARCVPTLAILLFLGSAGSDAPAGVIEFRAGGRVEAPVRVEGDRVLVHAPGGPYVFPRTALRRVIADPEEITGGDTAETTATARFEAAWKALEQGRIDEVEAHIHAAKSADPRFEPTARMARMLDRLAISCDDPNDPPAYPTGEGAWKSARSAHILLLHQKSDAGAQARLDLLETVLKSFYLSFAARGVDLRTPSERQTAIWFPDQGSYRAALRREHAEPFLNTRGYYHPTKRFVMTYDVRDESSFRRRAEALRRSDANADAQRLKLLYELDWRTLELSAAAHELTHQLVHISGLAPRHESFPVWLHEGLAMQFETIRGGDWAGVGRLNPRQLTAWRRITPNPAIEPLLRTATVHSDARYNAAWALIYFLRKTHPEAFQTWLDRLRSPSATDPAAEFRAVFGNDLTPLQRDWHAFMRALRLPAEEVPAAPARSAPP